MFAKTSEIESENLNAQQVRSFVARRLGTDIAGAISSDTYIEGIVQMMIDATQNYERLSRKSGSSGKSMSASV